MRLALLSLFSIADTVAEDACRDALDRATAAAYAAPPSVLMDDATEDPTATRFGAARVLNSLCAACRACGRGREAESIAALMMGAPPD